MINFQTNYLSPYIIWFADSLLSTLSTFFCFVLFHLLLEVEINSAMLSESLAVSAVSSVALTWLCKTYEGIIRHTTAAELMRIIYAMLLKTVILFILAHATLEYAGRFVHAIICSDFVCSIFLLMSVRVLVSNFYFHILRFTNKAVQKVLIYGTTDAAVSLANYLRNANGVYQLMGFITNVKGENKFRIVGYPVYYADQADCYRKLFQKHSIDCVLFVNHTDLRADDNLVDSCLQGGHVSMRIAPLVAAGDNLTNIQLRHVQIEDLLGREEINIHMDNIRSRLAGQTVMVTGAAGSIGSELCRQLCKFQLKQLILFDIAETGIYQIDMELKKTYPDSPILSIIGDVRNASRVESQLKLYRPDIIFHAAAYKHVPLMEEYPCEAVRTNVWGTSIVADLAVKYGVKKFIMISTDKAVRPSNVMGATKRLAEMYVQSLGNAIHDGKVAGKTSFITTRFGNVLGSNGSVIPLFRSQISAGGPVTVTHPDIIRYFMTIPEACRLVLEAAFLGEGNDIFIFDMGKPVKIADMACRMIKLAGLQPGQDIKIVYTGLRPGEKLYEELLYRKEDTIPTENAKIFRAMSIRHDFSQLKPVINRLIDIAHTDDKLETVREMKQIVPDFKSQHSVYEALDIPAKEA